MTERSVLHAQRQLAESYVLAAQTEAEFATAARMLQATLVALYALNESAPAGGLSGKGAGAGSSRKGHS